MYCMGAHHEFHGHHKLLAIRRLNRKAIYNLEKDLKDKFSAESLDDQCAQLKNHMKHLYLKPDAAKVEAK